MSLEQKRQHWFDADDNEYYASELRTAAAVYIAALEAEKAESWKPCWKTHYTETLQREIDLGAELAALKAAMSRIAEGSWNFGNDEPGLTVMEFARLACRPPCPRRGRGREMTALNVYRTATRIADEILSEQYATTLRASSVPREYADAAIAELEAEVERLQADTKRLMRILDDSGIGTPVEIVDRWNKARRRP